MFRALKQTLRRKKLERHGISIQIRPDLKRYGERSGTWSIIPAAIQNGDLVYSFGVGKNIAWDLDMVKHHRVELHAFDPTPRSAEWMSQQALPDGLNFHPLGLAEKDGHLEFAVPRKEHKVNYSAYKNDAGTATVSCAVKTLSSIMQSLGHTRVSILKMDIEGGEIDALNNILDDGIMVDQLLVEFHYHYPSIGFQRFSSTMHRLFEHGYRVFDISARGYEFSLVNQSVLDQ
ncbi:MAG: FkbM family methyltransferase [Pseudomonadota bacterium]